MTKYPKVNCKTFEADYGNQLQYFAYNEFEKNKDLADTSYVGYL